MGNQKQYTSTESYSSEYEDIHFAEDGSNSYDEDHLSFDNNLIDEISLLINANLESDSDPDNLSSGFHSKDCINSINDDSNIDLSFNVDSDSNVNLGYSLDSSTHNYLKKIVFDIKECGKTNVNTVKAKNDIQHLHFSLAYPFPTMIIDYFVRTGIVKIDYPDQKKEHSRSGKNTLGSAAKINYCMEVDSRVSLAERYLRRIDNSKKLNLKIKS